MTDGAGVPPFAGVAGLESDALPFSRIEAAATVGAGVELAGDSLAVSFIGVLSLVDWGPDPKMARRRSGETLRATILESLVLPVEEDLRLLSLAAAADLLVEGAIASIVAFVVAEMAEQSAIFDAGVL